MLIISLLFLGVVDEVLRNLYCVECCTFLNLVAHNPHDNAVGVGDVLAYAACIYGVAACAEKGDGVGALKEEMRGKVSLLAGNSGVGKSSLVNAVAAQSPLLVIMNNVICLHTV